MLSTLFPLIYGLVACFLLWQAFRVMGRGFFGDTIQDTSQIKRKTPIEDRTGRLTIHPELLDNDGRITDEDLLTVRFSGDVDPPQSAEKSAD